MTRGRVSKTTTFSPPWGLKSKDSSSVHDDYNFSWILDQVEDPKERKKENIFFIYLFKFFLKNFYPFTPDLYLF